MKYLGPSISCEAIHVHIRSDQRLTLDWIGELIVRVRMVTGDTWIKGETRKMDSPIPVCPIQLLPSASKPLIKYPDQLAKALVNTTFQRESMLHGILQVV